MGITNVMQTGRSGMVAAKSAIATSGHNIANANTEGYSRQRVLNEADAGKTAVGKGVYGNGVRVNRLERINDEYIEKQLRNSGRDLGHMEEKDLVLSQTENIFNEMGGEGLNRLMSKFFNEFRKLANEPESEAVRQSVREASQALVNDFKRLRTSVKEVQEHIDSRLLGQVSEINSLAEQIRDLNIKIKTYEAGNTPPNDLLDQRDMALKKLGSYMDLNMHKDNQGDYIVDIRGVGPLVVGPNAEKFVLQRSGADDQGKPENSYDVKTSASVLGNVTHIIKGGKMGALLEVRDQTLSTILNRLDELAYNVGTAVNQIHAQGITRDGLRGVDFFRVPPQMERAAEFIDLSNEVKANVNNIATAATPNSPGDNRIALALSGLQSMKLMNNGTTTTDDFYNSIVSDVGVLSARNKNSMTQAKDIQQNLSKMREQLSGVSIDEETTNLMQFHQAFGASARVIQVADEMLDTVLALGRH